jgi:hypothetical protein
LFIPEPCSTTTTTTTLNSLTPLNARLYTTN